MADKKMADSGYVSGTVALSGGDSGYAGDEGLEDVQMPSEPTRIAMSELAAYIEAEKEKGEKAFAQYNLIPLVTKSTRYVADGEANKVKNRYRLCLPYDYNRVVLEEIGGDPNSTYINASHIEGYPDGDREVKYIATQGPVDESISDFWRMIWENDVEKIVVLTVLMSQGKEKCVQYWPDLKANKDMMDLGNGYSVRTVTEENFPDYIIRTFELHRDEKTRKVSQFHFISWPDMGVPDQTTLLKFTSNQGEMKVSKGSPVVVHCSAGVGRTGTFLAIDNLLRQALAEDAVDVFKWVLHLRASRGKCVETLDQYRFIHESVLEAVSMVNNN